MRLFHQAKLRLNPCCWIASLRGCWLVQLLRASGGVAVLVGFIRSD